MNARELQHQLDIQKKIAPWKFKVPRLKKNEIPLERITDKKALDFFKNKAGYKSARIGPMVMFRGHKHYTIIVSIREFFRIQQKIIQSYAKKKKSSRH